MRSYVISIALCLITTLTGATYLGTERSRLETFCKDLPLGASFVQVRKSAQKLGFEPQMESFSQLRITPRFWHAAPPSCRVFFNRDQAVQFRIAQAS